MRVSFFSFVIICFIYSCNPSDSSEKKVGKEGTKNTEQITTTDQQLNINILWDLSDRIDTALNPASPQHYQRDIAAIQSLVEVFKADMNSKGAYKAKGKIKVFFTPTPADNNINSIAQNLAVD